MVSRIAGTITPYSSSWFCFLLLLLYACMDVEFPDRNLYDFYMYDVVPTILFHRDGGDGGGNDNGGSGDGRQWMLYQIEGSLR